ILPYVANRHPLVGLRYVEQIVNEYQDLVLNDYLSFGILVRLVHGHTQVSPALRKNNPNVQSEYYYAPTDRRGNGWVTVRRDHEGLRHDIELFQQLIDRNAREHHIQAFFEQHPAFLMQARNGIPIPHKPNFAKPANNKPDFAFSPILGPVDHKSIELLELKLPGERTLNRGFHRGLAAKVHRAIDQLKDYAQYLRDPANFQRILRAFGYLPDSSKLAVLIGRYPRNDADKEVWIQRLDEMDVAIITYDEILQTQADQLMSRI
ncbi:MAG TPA: Shedu anti-phage system protein SduA domain-containing protein, partial [Candidatus Angelobacter sp.]|nr:Shedu anti-phage system protein SduA domain-containing protein [Candidatus Angelobacter sp.]